MYQFPLKKSRLKPSRPLALDTTPNFAVSVFDFLARTLNGNWYTETQLTTSQGEYQLFINETASAFTVYSIWITPQGQGLGSELMEQLKRYADLTGKEFKAELIENTDFFDRFDFWSGYIKPQADKPGRGVYFPPRLITFDN